MLMLALASLLATPLPVGADRWFNSDDYPTDLMQGSRTAFEPVTQTLVDSEGKIVGCRVEKASSNPRIDALACAIILKRGRFEPARWTDGTPVSGVYRWPVLFMMWGDRLDRSGDIEIEVDSLPRREKSPVIVRVAFASTPDGKIVDCVAEPPVRASEKVADPVLLTLACEAVRGQWKPFSVLGADGNPSRSVQTAIVKFTSAKAR